jgi:limonene-1,2-epoxide hydrolase
MERSHINRRAFLGAAGVGAATVAGLPALLEAADWTAPEKANVAVVTEMCRAWAAPLDLEKVGSFLAKDCVYRPTETAPPIKGRQAIVEALKKMLGSPSKVKFEVVQTFARGPIVFNERFDRFTMPDRNLNWHGVGVFVVRDGKIAEWSDFTIQEKP